MPQLTNSPISRKHVIILIIALLLGIGFLLIRADRAQADSEPSVHVMTVIASIGDSSVSDYTVPMQITGEDYQSAVTLERLMILGMLGLVVLTWFYLKWRPPPDDEHPVQSDREP